MCPDNQENSAKARRFRKLGYAFLVIATLLEIFVHPSGGTTRIWLHATIDFLLGFAIVALLVCVRFSRRRA